VNAARRTTVGFYWACGGFVVAGFIAMILGWRGAAGTLAVPFQIPYLVSGGSGGLALVVTGGGLLYVQLSRQLAAEERRAIDAILSGTTIEPADIVAADDDLAPIPVDTA